MSKPSLIKRSTTRTICSSVAFSSITIIIKIVGSDRERGRERERGRQGKVYFFLSLSRSLALSLPRSLALLLSTPHSLLLCLPRCVRSCAPRQSLVRRGGGWLRRRAGLCSRR